MSTQDISLSGNADLVASLAAMRRAAKQARQTAIQTNTAIVVVQDGVVRRIPAEQLREKAPQKEGA